MASFFLQTHSSHLLHTLIHTHTHHSLASIQKGSSQKKAMIDRNYISHILTYRSHSCEQVIVGARTQLHWLSQQTYRNHYLRAKTPVVRWKAQLINNQLGITPSNQEEWFCHFSLNTTPAFYQPCMLNSLSTLMQNWTDCTWLLKPPSTAGADHSVVTIWSEGERRGEGERGKACWLPCCLAPWTQGSLENPLQFTQLELLHHTPNTPLCCEKYQWCR